VYLYRSTLGPVDLAFTDRHGGVSGVLYDELNLAMDGTEERLQLGENLRRVIADFAPDLADKPLHVAQMSQVHGSHVDLVEDRRSSGAPEADAMVTAQPNVALVVRVADCVPVILADPDAGVIGVAHAGRLGMTDGVVPATVSRMREVGAERIRGWVGPYICGRCYEVPAAMQAAVGALVPEAHATTSWGTPSLDLGAGVVAQLAREGIETVVLGACTLESAALYSYRRDGASAGRLAGLIRLRG
jgi:YfiH family protein